MNNNLEFAFFQTCSLYESLEIDQKGLRIVHDRHPCENGRRITHLESACVSARVHVCTREYARDPRGPVFVRVFQPQVRDNIPQAARNH